MKRLLLVMDLVPRARRTWEAWLISLAKQLRGEGVELCLVLSGEGPKWFLDEFHEAGGILLTEPGLRHHFDFTIVRKIMRDLNPSLLAFMFYPMFSSALLRLTQHRSLRASFYIDQSSIELPLRHGWRRLLVNLRGMLGSRFYKKIVTVSDFKSQRLQCRLGIPAKRIIRIYNGVPLERFVQASQATVAAETPIFFAGQIAEYKGVRTLLEAYRILQSENPSIPPLELAGDGPLRELLTIKIETWGLAGKVRFLGPVGDVPERMMAARCTVIPSEWDEACAFTAIEAMASGRPVIASDAGSLPELLGEAGIIHQARNANSLATSLKAVLNDTISPSPRARAAMLRQRAFENFNLSTMTEAYSHLFVSSS